MKKTDLQLRKRVVRILPWGKQHMHWTDSNYYRAYELNYRAAFSNGVKYIAESSEDLSVRNKRLLGLLKRIGGDPSNKKLLELGCGDGTDGLSISRHGYDYTGIDISKSAIRRARERSLDSNIKARWGVGNVLKMGKFKSMSYDIVLDCYCFHMLVLDSHRQHYFRNVRRVLRPGGYFIILAQRDDSSYDGPISSFEEFCRTTRTDPDGIPYQKKMGQRWINIKNERCYLMGRARSLSGYQLEISGAGFEILHRVLWENRSKVGFLLKKI